MEENLVRLQIDDGEVFAVGEADGKRRNLVSAAIDVAQVLEVGHRRRQRRQLVPAHDQRLQLDELSDLIGKSRQAVVAATVKIFNGVFRPKLHSLALILFTVNQLQIQEGPVKGNILEG